MQTMTNGPSERNLSDVEYEEIRFLTSGCCEDTGNVSADELKGLGLEFQTFEDASTYPLTDEEQGIIAEEYLDIDGNGLFCLMGYSALYKGRKYLVPTIEISFDGSMPNSMLTPPEAAVCNQKAKAIGELIADITGGHYMWREEPAEIYNDDHGRFVTELLIPVDYAKDVSIGLDTWQAHLKGIVSAM